MKNNVERNLVDSAISLQKKSFWGYRFRGWALFSLFWRCFLCLGYL